MVNGVRLSVATAERVVRQTRLGEATPMEASGQAVPVDEFTRFFRSFELAEELSGGAGSKAEVKWLIWDNANAELDDTGDTGEVEDLYGNAWGLEGERGEARFLGGKWIVCGNPGQPVYQGTFDDVVTAAGYADVSVTIDGNTRTVSANVPVSPGSGMYWEADTIVYISHTSGVWKVISITECPVSGD